MVVRDYSRCPRCGAATAKAVAFNEGESEFWYECTRCNTFINTYIPQAHQEAVHRDEVEVGSAELLRVFGGLLLRLEDGYRGAHICQRVVGVVELLAVVTPIDIGQAA